MKVVNHLTLLLIFLFAFACQPKDRTEPSYAVTPSFLQGYFLKEDFKANSKETTVILFHNKEEFDTFVAKEKVAQQDLSVTDFDKEYVMMITHNSQAKVQVGIESIEKKENRLFIKYCLSRGEDTHSLKMDALTLFTLPKDTSCREILAISPQNDTLVFSTRLQNMPAIRTENVYKGVVPCADCPGITLILKISDKFNEFELTQVYQGKIPAFVNRGTLQVERGFDNDKDATLYILDLGEKVEKKRYFVRFTDKPDQLLMLSPDKQIIESNLNYTLKKVSVSQS